MVGTSRGVCSWEASRNRRSSGLRSPTRKAGCRAGLDDHLHRRIAYKSLAIYDLASKPSALNFSRSPTAQIRDANTEHDGPLALPVQGHSLQSTVPVPIVRCPLNFVATQ